MNKLPDHDILSICYHDIFDYPLDEENRKKWVSGKLARKMYKIKTIKISVVDDFITIKNREHIVRKVDRNIKFSARKIKIAQKAAFIIGKIPTIKMVGISGSLAMKNAGNDSDIDLLIITEKGTMWSTRAFVFVLLKVINIPLRKPFDKVGKDKVCLNMWLDESSCVWKKSLRNIYTAHEISQIVPLIDKNNTFRKFRILNKWTNEYWPSLIDVKNSKINKSQKEENHIKNISKTVVGALTSGFFRRTEPALFKLQYLYMKRKITKETIKKNMALFHPKNMSDYVVKKIEEYCVNLNES